MPKDENRKEIKAIPDITKEEALHDAFEYIVMLTSLIAVIIALVPILTSIGGSSLFSEDFWHYNIQNHAIPGLFAALPFLIYSGLKIDRREMKNPKFKRTIYRLFMAYSLLAAFFLSFIILLETLIWKALQGFNIFNECTVELYSLILILGSGYIIWRKIKK